MKAIIGSAVLAGFLFLLGGCSAQTTEYTPSPTETPATEAGTAVSIVLSENSITVDGQALSPSSDGAVQMGQSLYNAAEEGDSATAVVITQPGTYCLSGTLSDGQIAVDLGAEAVDDPAAVVTLILDGVDITCSTAPALVISRAYECADTQAKITAAQVDTRAAGVRLVLADGSENALSSTSAGAEGALTTAVSLNLSGQETGDGLLSVTSRSAGISGAVHLTLDGGRLMVQAQGAALQVQEEALSVITINDGKYFLNGGLSGTGDGAASQGYLVINGGEVVALAAGQGLSAVSGIQIQGGSVLALGSAVSPVDPGSTQAVLEWTFLQQQDSGAALAIVSGSGETLLSYTTQRPCSALLYSAPELTDSAACTVTVNGDAAGSASASE